MKAIADPDPQYTGNAWGTRIHITAVDLNKSELFLQVNMYQCKQVVSPLFGEHHLETRTTPVQHKSV